MKNFKINDVYTGKTIGEYGWEDFAAVEKKLARSQKPFIQWSNLSIKGRVKILRKSLAYFKQNKDAIAKDISQSMGRPFHQAKGEIDGLLERANYLLKIGPKVLAPEVLPSKKGLTRRIEHEALGNVLIIPAWNYPLLTAINGIMAALLAGNCVLLKHARQTISMGIHFAKAFGAIKGYRNLLQHVVMDHSTSARIIQKSAIHHVVFTGSVEGGRQIYKSVSERFIDCNLELGGKDAAYVARDAYLKKAAVSLVDGACFNSGQSCCGIERVYVQQEVHKEFVEHCLTLIKQYKLGDPMDSTTSVGPLCKPSSTRLMESQLRKAKQLGAKVLLCGKARNMEKGRFFEPTLVVKVKASMEIMQEENFGPILPIQKVKDDTEALKHMNNSPYGLTAVIFTSNSKRAETP